MCLLFILFFFSYHTQNVLLSELSLPVTLQWEWLLSEASSGCLIITSLQAVHHRAITRQRHQQTGLWVADEEEEDAAHVCREEELTFPWEREVWELLSLSLSDGFSACSIMKWTTISATAELSVSWREKKMPGGCPMAQECRAGFPFLSSHRCPWSNSRHHRWDGRALSSWPGHRLGYQTAGINHTYSLNNFKMSCFGVDDKFLEEKWRSHVILQKLKIKWKATPNWKLFIQKMSWRIF